MSHTGPSVASSSVTGTDAALNLLTSRRFVAVTGAGLSTDSGIPDYRGPGSSARTPMTYQDFVSGPVAQRRYWARSHLGWGRMRHAAPNPGHEALARLERQSALRLLITQNVDGLHERAGSENLVALHGRISDVICLGCRRQTSRAALHLQLEELNPGFAEDHADAQIDARLRPDGDVELDDTVSFRVPGCESCGGVLKPDVVFFGENVPKPRVERCYAAVDEAIDRAEAVLVAGSSLTVMSGFRFVRRAARAGCPVVIVNRGTTRGDDLATYKLEVGCSEFLSSLAGIIGSAGPAHDPAPAVLLDPVQETSRRTESSRPSPASTTA